ncbi:argonaute family protein [Wolffia australiana]
MDDNAKFSHRLPHPHHLLLRHHGFSFNDGATCYQAHPPLLPLLPLPPLLPSRSPPVLPTPTVMEAPRKKPSYPVAKKEILTKAGIAKRPDSGGKEGRQILLVANHFKVEFDPSQRIFHYDIDISPRPCKDLARQVKKKLVEAKGGAFGGAAAAFDGRRNLYTPTELPLPSDRAEIIISLQDKRFRVSVKLVAKLSAGGLAKFLQNEAPLPPQDLIHALDVVLREGAMDRGSFLSGRSLFSGGAAEEIGGAAVARRGFFQSLRPTRQGLALNVDLSVMAFHEPVNLIFYLQKRFEFLRDLPQRKSRALTLEERRAVEKALKSLRVTVRHRRSDQRFKILGLTEEATAALAFKDRDGREMKIVEYYREQYEIEIQFKSLPCLQMSRSKPCFLPMELCDVCEGQKVLGRLTEEQIAKLRRLGCQSPRKRRQSIDSLMAGPASPASGRYAAGFNLRVATEMTRVTGRVLPPPKLKLGDGGHVRELTPSRHDRQWSLVNSHVVEGSWVRRWALLSFGGSPDQLSTLSSFALQLSNRCHQLGISLAHTPAAPPQFEPIHILSHPPSLEAKLRRLLAASGGELQLLICVMEKRHRGYAELKRIADTAVGVISQCCLLSNCAKPTSQFLSNLALKINVKLGGCNVALSGGAALFSGDDDAAIFMGADVTHPHPLDDASPSVAAVVGSLEWPAANRYAAAMRSQAHREEIIQDMEGMAGEILREFRARQGRLPQKIVFFRDGVSESMFQRVLKGELAAIRAACEKFPDYHPRITFAVVQKRHHTRLFGGAGEEENVPPGTVVDTVITHPGEFNFYLCSHWGAKGTARPTRYHVLWDENSFSSDEFQGLVHSLCYTFARCTMPVSLVPPAYYAHLAAYRGRMYLADGSGGSGGGGTLAVYRAAGVRCAAPLPKVRDSVNKLMFFC